MNEHKMRIHRERYEIIQDKKPVSYILISILVGLGVIALAGLFFSLYNPVAIYKVEMEAPRQMYPQPTEEEEMQINPFYIHREVSGCVATTSRQLITEYDRSQGFKGQKISVGGE